MKHSGCNLTGVSPEIQCWTNHVLHRKTERFRIAIVARRNGLEIIQQASAIEPGCPRAVGDDIVTVQCADREETDFAKSQIANELAELGANLVENFLAEVDQVHFVY